MEEGAVSALIILLLLFFAIVVLSAYLIYKVVFTMRHHRVKTKLKKVDLENYEIIAYSSGIPITLQSKINPNEIIYL